MTTPTTSSDARHTRPAGSMANPQVCKALVEGRAGPYTFCCGMLPCRRPRSRCVALPLTLPPDHPVW